MKNVIFFLASIILAGSVHAQVVPFTELNATAGSQKKVEWLSSTYGSGFGHKIYNNDVGSGYTVLNFAGRHNTSGWTDIMTLTSTARMGIGTVNPLAKFHLFDDQNLGSTNNASHLLMRISGKSGNVVMNNIWLRRDASGSDWWTVRFHDGLSVDGSYLTPGTDTRTWWERDPYNNIQSWGNASTTFMTLKEGKLGIGTATMGSHLLAVNGSIGAREIKVETGTWSDFVFDPSYQLIPLPQLEEFILTNRHLPEIPTEAEVLEEGINLGEMNAKLLQKVEELTLYLIQQNKEIEQLKAKVKALEGE